MPRVGIISDTHGLLRPEVIDRLQGVDRILHAGDVVGIDVIETLQSISPVHAVRGNCDNGEWSMQFPKTDYITIGPASIYLLHILYDIDIAPGAAGVNIIVSGHTHKPLVEEKGGVIYINPGSCGPRRFSLPISMAIMEIEGNQCKVELFQIDNPSANQVYTFTL